MKERKSIIGNTLLLAWFTLCILVSIYFPNRVSYIYWSNLIDLSNIIKKVSELNLTNFLINLLIAFIGMAIFSISNISLGAFLAKYIDNDESNLTTPLSALVQLATRFLLGQAVFSIIFLTFAGVYKLTSLIVITMILLGLLLGSNLLKKYLSFFFKQSSMASQKNRIIFWLSIIILILTIFLSSARISYDSSSIYFSDAKLTAIREQISFFKNDVFSASVFHSAIEFTAIIQVFGDQSARMFSWINGVIIIIFSLALGEKVGLSKGANTIVLALLSTSTAFIDLMGDGKVDLISSAPALAAIYLMVDQSQKQSHRRSSFLLIGFFVGLAIIGRPFNAFLLGIFCILFYFKQIFLKTGLKFSDFNISNTKRFIGLISWVGIGASILGIFHLFANWIILGSPLAFLSSLSNINPAVGPWDFDPKQMQALRLLYLFAATFRNTPQSLGNISPMVIAFLPALFIRDIRKNTIISNELKGLVIISVITIFLWIFSFFTVVEIRYVFFLWIIIFLPVAEIINKILESEYPIFPNMAFGLISLLLGFIAFRTMFIAIDSYSPIDRQGDAHCSGFSQCDYLNAINETAAPGERILGLSAYRYYLRTDLFSCSTTHDEYEILNELSNKDTEMFWLEVYRQGYKYIAYEKEYTKRHIQLGLIPGPENTPLWMHLDPIYGQPGDPVIAYKINTNNPPGDIKQVCKKNQDNIWEVIAIK